MCSGPTANGKPLIPYGIRKNSWHGYLMKAQVRKKLLSTTDGGQVSVFTTAVFTRPNTSLTWISGTIILKRAGAWVIPMGITGKKMPGIIIQAEPWSFIYWTK